MDFNDKALILTSIITYTKLCRLFIIEGKKKCVYGWWSWREKGSMENLVLSTQIFCKYKAAYKIVYFLN